LFWSAFFEINLYKSKQYFPRVSIITHRSVIGSTPNARQRRLSGRAHTSRQMLGYRSVAPKTAIIAPQSTRVSRPKQANPIGWSSDMSSLVDSANSQHAARASGALFRVIEKRKI
jgi:hypothetical protein